MTIQTIDKPIVRISIALLFGTGITGALFVLMASFVKNDQQVVVDEQPTIPVVVAQAPEKSKPEEIDRSLPQPPPVPEIPELSTEMTSTTESSISIAYTPPQITTNTGIDTNLGGSFNDGDARPIVQVNPEYPVPAARDGIEGWVLLSFSINEIGAVEDVVVLDAEPKKVFNKSARRALRKWKYQPKSVNGKKVKQTGLTIQLDFTMEKQA